MLLDKIDSPADLRKLPVEELSQLASEMRRRMIEVVSRTGGHLASSLGAVELTVALHYCLNTPQDTIVWDVGHQSYAHKILTGRNKQFECLRQYQGISGFPSKQESVYDAFTTGHSSTAVSLALGIACANEQTDPRSNSKSVAVIGDGSLSGGLCFEGLNCAGHLKKNLIVVLNTNELSIAPSVGAISTYLNKLISLPLYNRFRESLESFVRSRLPKGSRMIKLATKFEEGLKGLFIPGLLFEELGFRYFGPFDGHNIPKLVSTLRNIISLKGPVLLHVITKKGKGYAPAEANPVKFHSAPAFDIDSGRVSVQSKQPQYYSYTEVFSGKLLDLGACDPKLVAITAAMPEGTGLDKFRDAYPSRFFDVGIAEQHAVCFAAGLARKGLKPVVAIYSSFLQRAYDQIIECLALQKLPVVLAIDRSGIVGEDGATHQGIFDIAFLRHIPDLAVMAPKDGAELEQMLDFALNINMPSAIRYPKAKCRISSVSAAAPIELGKGELLRKGADAVIFALGSAVEPSLKAAETLAAEGINLCVVNSRFVKPIDRRWVDAMSESFSRIFTAEEAVLAGGFGSALAELTGRQVVRIGLPDEFIPYGRREELLSLYGLDSKGIASVIKKNLSDPG